MFRVSCIQLCSSDCIKSNLQRSERLIKKAVSQKANLIITPELSLWGYPAKDLLFDSSLIENQLLILDKMVEQIKHQDINSSFLIGIAEPAKDLQLPRLFNSIVLLNATGWEVVARKQLLPTYDVFDEKRYFRPANNSSLINLKSKEKSWQIGLSICEDLWVEEEIQGQRIAGADPVASLSNKKVDLLLNLSASPFSHEKDHLRKRIAAKAAIRLNCPVIYLNQVGGNDDLIFDGSSFAIDKRGMTTLTLPICQ